MKISIGSMVPAPRERVFAALIDPAVLQRASPGCEAFVATGADEYEATLKIGVAGLKGTYTGKARIRDKQPPESLSLSFEGKGGPGFVRGTSNIRLSTEDSGTRIGCDADVQVGGLIAAVGSRLVEAAAKKVADDFFRQLAQELAAQS